MWHGSPRKPHQFELGADDGCFASALASVRRWGGVLEHPAYSHAWTHFGIPRPARGAGWLVTGDPWNGATCYVEQGHYGHKSNKPTWLYAVRVKLPPLDWRLGGQRLDPVMLERHGYLYARRKGLVSMIGGKDKSRLREATTCQFAQLLIKMAHSVNT